MLRHSLALTVLLAASTALAQSAAAPAADKPADTKKADDNKADDNKADDKKAGDKKAGDKKAGDKKAGDKKADDKKADDKAGDAKPAETPAGTEVPALPPPAETTPTAPTEEPTAPAGMSPEDMAKLKAQLKAELETELKAQMQNEMEAAARDAATQKAAAQEWEEEKWVEEVKPTLNFLQLDGYFRTRFDLFNRLDLGTFDPNAGGGVGRGTSMVPPPTMYRPFDGDNCTASTPNFPGDTCSTQKEDTETLLTMNMRLRLNPTLNVSDDIKIKSTVDVFDNLVYGSTPEALPGFANGNPTLPLPLFTQSQNSPQVGLNSIYDAIRIKRVWAEVTTPLGQLRFGRMPVNFGLGILANDGNKLTSDYGDNADQILFATRIAGHYIVPAYSWSSSGPFGRGGGSGIGGDADFSSFANEGGTRYNLDPRDDVHSFILVIAKKDKEEDITEQLRNGGIVLNYGAFLVYRTQQFDDPAYYTGGVSAGSPNPVAAPEDYVRRDANAGIGSLWGRFQWDKLKIEAEAVGILGQISGTAVVSGQGNFDPRLKVLTDATQTGDNAFTNQPLIVFQGGAAVESSYKLLNDQLTIGLDGGIASGDDAFGMGLRPVLKQEPKPGDLDGQQYGQCLERDPDGHDIDGDGVVDCVKVDNDVTNYRFNPDYAVDLILFREVLGTVTDAFYVKPHIGYNLTENLGARADVMYAEALFASSTPGQQNPLGLEVDLSGFYGTEDGFYLMAQYGIMLPFGAFAQSATDVDPQFRSPQFAQTFQVFGGVQF